MCIRDSIPARVDEHLQDASPYGIRNLCGNAWEWVEAGGGAACLKGGSWCAIDGFEYLNRWGGMACARGPIKKNERFNENLGFRTVCEHIMTKEEYTGVYLDELRETLLDENGHIKTFSTR